MALIFSVYPPEQRVRAMGWWSMTGAAAPALGLALTLNCVLHRENLASVPELIRLAERLRADRLEFGRIRRPKRPAYRLTIHAA